MPKRNILRNAVKQGAKDFGGAMKSAAYTLGTLGMMLTPTGSYWHQKRRKGGK